MNRTLGHWYIKEGGGHRGCGRGRWHGDPSATMMMITRGQLGSRIQRVEGGRKYDIAQPYAVTSEEEVEGHTNNSLTLDSVKGGSDMVEGLTSEMEKRGHGQDSLRLASAGEGMAVMASDWPPTVTSRDMVTMVLHSIWQGAQRNVGIPHMKRWRGHNDGSLVLEAARKSEEGGKDMVAMASQRGRHGEVVGLALYPESEEKGAYELDCKVQQEYDDWTYICAYAPSYLLGGIQRSVMDLRERPRWYSGFGGYGRRVR
ncbi:hypothetical protein BDQ17DRAFT_1327292 [Cyathus striatus]|nr:hypothetical protein BDQ17DRAFT_1327292 [Cyathus striatus]